jgi:hypothetical protein
MTSGSPSPLQRFEHGRHETFAIRHTWLSKGLARIQDAGGTFQADLDTADALGLGSKMVKSLSYWLEASGLASATLQRRSRQLAISHVGSLIARRDPYFEFPATWWFIHISIASRDGSVFAWFFNDFVERNFDRLGCLDAFQRHVRERATKAPSVDVAQREVSCLLASYADEFGKIQDPEDSTVCPLTDLGLLVHYNDTRRFERMQPLDKIPVEAFLWCVSKLGQATGLEAVSIAEMMTRRYGPGRLFNIGGEALDAAAAEAARVYRRDGVTLELLGAERRLRAAHKSPGHWLERYYDRIGVAA